MQSQFNNLIVITVIAAAIAPAAPASAQCDGWADFSGGVNEGFGSTSVHALTVYNGELIVGGIFTMAGGQSANNIARWDAATNSWQPLGDGLQGPVRALAVYAGELIAGGDFGAGFIRRWNGSTWQALGPGLTGSVRTLTLFNGELIAGGSFLGTGTPFVPLSRIARWNGSSWQPLGSGVFFDIGGVDGGTTVSALHVHENALIVGGIFNLAGGAPANGIAQWNGSSWQALGAGTGFTEAVTTYAGDLVASSNATYRWNGASWQVMGPFVSAFALAVVGGELHAGRFGGVHAWNPKSNLWEPLGPGVSGGGFQPVVNTLTGFNGELVAGGRFTMAGSHTVNHIARWQGCPGACCIESTCVVVTSGTCSQLGGAWQGDGSDCCSSACANVGACCVNGEPICITADQCTQVGGVFHGEGVPSDAVKCDPTCAADLNADGQVGVPDLLQLLGAWGACP